MLKLIFVAIPWVIGAYFAGIFSHKWWVSFIEKKEARLKVRIERQTLEEIPTESLVGELFERDEAWDAISEQADKNERKF